MKWRHYFTSTIIGRGQNYYNKGRIDKFEKIGDKYYAELRGSRPYQVVIWETEKKTAENVLQLYVCAGG